MTFVVFLGSESDLFHCFYHQDITYHIHDGGTCGGCKSKGAYLIGMTGAQNNIGLAGQRTGGVTGQDNELKCGVKCKAQLHEFKYLSCLAGVGYQKEQVVFLQNAQITVLSLTGMEEYGRSTCGTEGGGYIHSDLACLTHSACNQFSFKFMHVVNYQIHRFFVLVTDGDVQDGLSLAGDDILN